VAARRPPRDPHGATPLLEQLRDLAALIIEHGLTEIEVERAGTRIRVARQRVGVGPGLTGAIEAAPVATTGVHGKGESAVPPHLIAMEAPMVGTFYRAANPQAPPYVNEGDHVKEGQVLCIIEAMKLMNEIEAKTSGRVARILVENAQPVEYGQPLFLLDPAAPEVARR
jgi:acetyl-CoA carboxylase biotin carboxyl carrier protein